MSGGGCFGWGGVNRHASPALPPRPGATTRARIARAGASLGAARRAHRARRPARRGSPSGNFLVARGRWPAPRYQKIAPAVKKLYEASQQSTRQLMDYFQIDARRTRSKILRFAGCQVHAPAALAAGPVAEQAWQPGNRWTKRLTKAKIAKSRSCGQTAGST